MATKDRTSLKNDFANGKYATGEKFADLIDSMKVVQLPVVDPQALGTSLSFIDSISQDADGKITATKKTLDLANAHELNPFKGWYKTGDTLPTDGFDGAYLYFKDTSELTGQTTIYRWNGTTYADTGTVVDTSNMQTFGSGQAVNAVKIKDENGEEVTGDADVLSTEAGKKINEATNGIISALDLTENEELVSIKPPESEWFNGAYTDNLSNFTENNDISSCLVNVAPGEEIIIGGKRVGSNYRVFDGAGNEIKNGTQAYFYNQTNGTFTMPSGAAKIQIFRFTNGSEPYSGIEIKRMGVVYHVGLVQKTVVCEAIGEALYIATGLIYTPCDSTQKKSFVTPKFFKIDGRTEHVDNIEVANNENYLIFQYDEDFTFLARNVNDMSLSDECRFIKIATTNKDSSQYAYSFRKLVFTVSIQGDPCWVANGVETPSEAPQLMFRTYEIKRPFEMDDTDTPTTDYRGVQIRVFNRGYICLPPNYSRTGKPCKVAIYCNGTSGFVFGQNSLPYNNSYVQFMAKCGYAVIGCSTRTELFANNSGIADGDLVHPLAFSCYENLWKYMTESYNIDKSGAYIWGLSSGGLFTIMLSQLSGIPIKAAASHSGSVDMFANMRICVSYLNSFWFNRLGMTYENLPHYLSSQGALRPVDEAVKTFILSNLDKFKGYNPFFFNNNIDFATWLNAYLSTSTTTSALESNQTIVAMIENAKVNLKVPLKIWHAVDDSNVPIAMSRFYQKMVKNGGGICYLRELPAGCGAHHAVGVDIDDEATPKTDYITPFGETVNIAVAYAELVDWFERW